MTSTPSTRIDSATPSKVERTRLLYLVVGGVVAVSSALVCAVAAPGMTAIVMLGVGMAALILGVLAADGQEGIAAFLEKRAPKF